MKLRVMARLIQIQRVLVRHGLDDFVRETHLYRPLRFVFLASPWTWLERRKEAPRAERLRLALEELGPIFIKLGQALSTRRDLLPPDIALELAKLQDRVPPFDNATARAIIEKSLGRPVTESFVTFETQPLAAASIAHVHAATLKDGTDVVVKVLRPGMKEIISRDLEVMHELARLAKTHSTEARRLRVDEIVDEYEKTILDELDLMREAANASQLKRNFEGSSLLHVPTVYWDLCRIDVMVMERIRGVTISDMDTLRAKGANIAMLAENGVKIFFTQVFRQIPAMPPSTSASWARSTSATSTTWLRISSPCSIGITAAWRNYMCNRVGCRPTPASTRWNRPSAPCSNPSLTGRSKIYLSAPSCCACSTSHAASTCVSSRS